MATIGYSAAPLAKKLGIKEGYLLRLINAPPHYLSLFEDWPQNVSIENSTIPKKDFIHFLTAESAQLFAKLPLLKEEIRQAGAVWVSWPKKAAKVPTDITEDVIRDFAIRIGLVDVKVCAVDAVWSGLKLIIPIRHRKSI